MKTIELPSANNGWKNFCKMRRDNGLHVWVHKDVVKRFQKLGYKLVKSSPK